MSICFPNSEWLTSKRRSNPPQLKSDIYIPILTYNCAAYITSTLTNVRVSLSGMIHKFCYIIMILTLFVASTSKSRWISGIYRSLSFLRLCFICNLPRCNMVASLNMMHVESLLTKKIIICHLRFFVVSCINFSFCLEKLMLYKH